MRTLRALVIGLLLCASAHAQSVSGGGAILQSTSLSLNTSAGFGGQNRMLFTPRF